MALFSKLIGQIADPKNKETYKTMSEAFGSVQEAQDSGALEKIKSFAGGLVGIADLLSPVSDLLQPFSDLGDIFSAEVEGSLANILSGLFTTVLNDTNLALISSLATKFGGLFETVFTETNIKLIGSAVEAFLTLMTAVIDSITTITNLLTNLETFLSTLTAGGGFGGSGLESSWSWGWGGGGPMGSR